LVRVVKRFRALDDERLCEFSDDHRNPGAMQAVCDASAEVDRAFWKD
jgi:hypothetical protein